MQTAALTFAALGTGALFLGYIEVLGSASKVVHVGLLLLGVGALMVWSLVLADAPPRRAGGAILLLSGSGVSGLVGLAYALRPQALPYAVVAAALLLLAAGAVFFAREAPAP